MAQWKNLVFEGGGVKGLAYAGTLKVLEEQGVLEDIVRVGGSSAGGITAGMLALGMKPDDIEEEMDKTDFKRFMDDDWGVVRDTNRLLKEYGWHKGEAFKNWFRKIIRKNDLRDDITFAELKKKPNTRDLYMTGTNINYMYTKLFSHEHTPEMQIVDALRITMSFPFFFKAVSSKDDMGGELKEPKNSVFIDGGLLRNYPINFFDNKKYIKRGESAAAKKVDYVNAKEKRDGYVFNCQALGVRIDSPKEVAAYEGGYSVDQDVDGFLSFAFALVNTLAEASNRAHLHRNDWHRTIFIENPGVGSMEFTLNRKKKNQLLKNGVKGAQKYFTWFNDPNHEERPINKYLLSRPPS
jgi:NTE family protein